MYCICKNCKQKAEVDTDLIYTTFPPQYRYHCDFCDEYGWISIDDLRSEQAKETLKEKISEAQADLNLKVLIEQVKEQKDEIEQLKKEIEQLKYINKQITYVPINIPEIKTTETNPCEYCPSNPRYKTNGIYVGDSPCQWCPHSPYRTTCSSTTNIKESK